MIKVSNTLLYLCFIIFYQISDWWKSQRTVGGEAETPRYRWLQLSVEAKCNCCVVLKTLLCKWLLHAVVTKLSETRCCADNFFVCVTCGQKKTTDKSSTSWNQCGNGRCQFECSDSAVNEVRENTSIKDIASVNDQCHTYAVLSTRKLKQSVDDLTGKTRSVFCGTLSGENNVFEEMFQTY